MSTSTSRALTVLHDVTWQLQRGEHWGIVGANGSGKSTLLGLIAGTIWPAPERGTRRYDFGHGAETDAVRARSEIVLVGHELQDRYARLGWNFTALDVVLSGVYRTDVPRRRPAAGQRERALAVLRRLGVAELAARKFPRAVARRAAPRADRARRRVRSPPCCCSTSPRAGSIAAARNELGAMLELVAKECTLVCAAHVPDDLPPLITRYLELDAGHAVAVERDGTHTRGCAQTPRRRADAVTAGATARRTRTDGAVDRARPRRRVARRAARACTTSPGGSCRGEHWLVTGANGSGKSSLLRLLHGQLRPALGGEVAWPALGNPRDVWQLRKQIAWVSPELQAAYRYPTTVRACIASGFTSSVGQTRAPTRRRKPRASSSCSTELELAPTRRAAALARLSYGQARRALLGRVLANHPRVLLLDEPWEGLDAPMAELLNATLERVDGRRHAARLRIAPDDASRALHARARARRGSRRARRDRRDALVMMQAPHFAEVAPVRRREQHAGRHVDEHLDGRVPGAMAPERGRREHGNGDRAHRRRCRRAGARVGRARTPARSSARRTTASANGNGRRRRP